jgi:pimeloyl-ACP methyl ester carboxylesterase
MTTLTQFPTFLTTSKGFILSCSLILGSLFGILLLQYYFPLSSIQASMWSVLGFFIACSFGVSSKLPYRKRNVVLGITGIINTLCCFCSFIAFCIGTTLKTSDKTAMGIALFTCLLITLVCALWTLLPLFPLTNSEIITNDTSSLVIKNDEEANNKNIASNTNHEKCSSPPCLACLTIAWMFFTVIVILFTHDSVGYVNDYVITSPPSTELILPSTTTTSLAMMMPAAAAADDPDYPSFTNNDGKYFHMKCVGTGTPLVLLEHGRGGTLWDWGWIQANISTATRVCSWSRLGYGFSTRGTRRRTSGRITNELEALLQTQNITEPFIHVGHSFGGLVLRSYQAKYPDRILAQVFVDAMNADCFKPCDNGVIWTRGVGHLLATVVPTGIARVLSETENLPLDGSALLAMLPQDVRNARRASFISTNFWNTYGDEEDDFPTSCYISRTRGNRNITSIPVVSVIAEFGIHQQNDTDTELYCGHQLATSVGGNRGRSLVVKGAGHIELVFDKQFAVQVNQVILDVLQEVRMGK